VVGAHEEAVALEVEAEFERRPEDRQALFFRDPVRELVRSQPSADVRDGLELSGVLILEQGCAHLRFARVHIEDVLGPASRECEDRRGRKGLFKPVERLFYSGVAGGTSTGAVDPLRTVNGAAIRAKFGTKRRKTLHIPT